MAPAPAPQRRFSARRWWLAAILVVVGLGILSGWIWREPLGRLAVSGYALMVDSRRMAQWVADQGAAAPAVFICLQIAQVILAPIPGEATGFAGGVLFGTGAGFVYSTIGLTLGSWINLVLGRVLGRAFVRRVVAARHLEHFDRLMQGQGLMAALALFVLPGFPKDYLCLFLGLSHLPLRVLLPLAAVGRLPGTFLLSLQGASLAGGNIVTFATVTLACGLGLYLAYRYREKWQQWIARWNSAQAPASPSSKHDAAAEDGGVRHEGPRTPGA